MKNRLAMGLTSALVLSVIASTPALAQSEAALAAEGEDDAVVDAFEALSSGNWTESDLDLLRSDPQLAATVIDPTSGTFEIEVQDVSLLGTPLAPAEVVSSGELSDAVTLTATGSPDALGVDALIEKAGLDAGSLVVTAAATSCKTVTARVRAYTLLGDLMFKWAYKVQFCYNGSKVTSVPSRYDYLEWDNGFVVVGSLVANSLSGVGTSTAVTFRQRELKNCIAYYGCVYTYHPKATISMYGSGGYRLR